MLFYRAHHITRRVLPAVYHMTFVFYLVSPGSFPSLWSFHRFLVSLLFYRYRYRYTNILSVRTVFLVVSLPNDDARTFGTISTTYVHILRFFLTPFQLFSCSVFRLSLYSFCSNRTIHIQTGTHNPMPSGTWRDTRQSTSQSGPTAVGAGGPFLP